MIINVGSQNQTKITAVKEALVLYPELFIDPQIIGIKIDNELYGHPKSLEETIAGACDRAKQAFHNCDYSFGIEGGLQAVPNTKSGFMEIGVCAVYDGIDTYIGLSPAFEWPKQVTELILSGKADASQAFKQLNLTDKEKLGATPGGILGFLTKGRMRREDQTKAAIITALIQLDMPNIYLK